MELQTAIAAAGAALQVIKGAIAARDDAKAQAALFEVQDRLLAISTTSLDLSDRNAALQALLHEAEREKRELKGRLEERGSYVLHEIRPGAFCYASKPAHEGLEPAHYLCQLCYDKGIKSVLRFTLKKSHLDCVETSSHSILLVPAAHNLGRRGVIGLP
jgi:hypothetical protein